MQVERQLVCVKVIKVKNIPKKEREACRMEVSLLKRLNHPNIVGYRDSFLAKNKESLCIVMQFADGGDLATQIKQTAKQRKLFAESKILHWFVQMTLGLHYMHSNRVLHRDLKTQNIFLLGNGRLVLGDLGISKVLEGTMDFAQTCIGTPYYMSPEIFKNKPYNQKSDIWALGCVLYEMTTLNHAFDANSLNGLACKIIKGRYPPIASRYSKSLRELIGAMLATSPSQRPHLEGMLQRPFIKRHIKDFLADIISRPTSSVGEGTMQVRAAVACAAPNSAPSRIVGDTPLSQFAGNAEVAALREQLESLQMQDIIAAVVVPKQAPTSALQAEKAAREQASALRREEERRRAVEEALDKLRKEREQRLRDRDRLRAEAQKRAAARLQRGQGVAAADRQQQRGYGRPGYQQYGRQGPPPSRQAQRRQAWGARNGGAAVNSPGLTPNYEERKAERNRQPQDQRQAQDQRRPRSNAGAVVHPDAQHVAELEQWEDRQQRLQADRVRARRHVAAPVRVSPPPQRAIPLDPKYGVSPGESKEENDAKARREARRELERVRQREIIAKLKEDKIALDLQERQRQQRREEQQRQQRREEQRRREQLERERKKEEPQVVPFQEPDLSSQAISSQRGCGEGCEAVESNKAAPSPALAPPSLEHDGEGVGRSLVELAQAKADGNKDSVCCSQQSRRSQAAVHPIGALPTDESSSSAAEILSARDRVLMRKQEAAAEKEAERLQQLNEAHAQASQLRQQAKTKQNDQYRSSIDLVVQRANHAPLPSARQNSVKPPRVAMVPASRAVSESETEMARHEQPVETIVGVKEAAKPASQQAPTDADGDAGDDVSLLDVDEVPEDDDSESMGWAQPDPDNIEDAEEDLHHREEELKAELEYTKSRCEVLRKTLQDTKTFIANSSDESDVRGGDKQVNDRVQNGRKKWARPRNNEVEVRRHEAQFRRRYRFTAQEDDDDCLYEEEEEDESVAAASVVSVPQRAPQRVPQSASEIQRTPPEHRTPKFEVPPPKTPRDRDELADGQSPSSRLAVSDHLILNNVFMI